MKLPTYLLNNLRHNAGADGMAAFADSEAETFFHSDRSDQLDAMPSTLSPGMIISVPAGSVATPVTSVVRK